MGWNPIRARREREERELVAAEEFRSARRLINEDITVFGEQLTHLHVETLNTELDEAMRRDYQLALDHYEEAKADLSEADELDLVVEIDKVLTDGRFYLACVLAARDGGEPPTRRESCFFNPQHGPGTVDISWAPPSGVARTIAVCGNDANRIAAGEEPESRMVRMGDRYVAWHAAGGSMGDAANYRAHVTSGGDTRLTSKHVAEAHIRAGNSGANSIGPGRF